MIVCRKGWGVQLNTYQIEAAWKLGNWEKLKTFVKVVSCSHKKITLNALFATKVVCLSCLLKCLRSLFGNQCELDQTAPQAAPIGAVCSGSTLFASLLNLSVMLGNYLQQMTSADDIFRCMFFLDL